MQKFLRGHTGLAISDLVEIELVSAIARKVRKREVHRTDAQRTQAVFLAHVEAGYYARLPVTRLHYTMSRDWLSLTPLPLLTLGALHLAVAVSRHATIATCDAHLARIAASLGIPVELLD